jgi:hypothetical protein
MAGMTRDDDDITSLNYRTLLAERIIETLEAFNLLKLEDLRTFNDVLADMVLDVPPQHYRLGRAPYLGNEGASDVVKALVRLLGVVGFLFRFASHGFDLALDSDSRTAACRIRQLSQVSA